MLIQDLRFALRSLALRPGFAAISIVTLALGIGATTSIFSVVRAVLLRPLEYAGSERLVKVYGFNDKEGTAGNLSPADFMDFERDNPVFSRMGANGYVGLATISGGRGDAERVGSVNVTEGFFETLEVRPALGRLFRPEDDRPDAPVVVVISDGFWRRRYGADPAIVGSIITFNAAPATVVGILPASYRHLEINPERPADLFVPFRFDRAAANRGGHFIRGVARLKEGVTPTAAQAQLDTIATRLSREFASSNTDLGVRVTPLLESIVGETRPVLVLLMGAVALVLLVACANVANLLLARGTGRLRELALRAAIGADRGRLVRQMLTESAVMSVLGAAGGLLVAMWATRALATFASSGMPRADQVGIDGFVLAFTMAAALVTSVLFGLLPALHLSRLDLGDSLKEGGRHQGSSVGRGAREALIVAEVALSLVLLVGAGLLLRSLWQLQRVSPGFSPERVLAMEVALPTAIYEEGQQMPFYQRLEERLLGISGVAGVGAINILPLSNNYDSRGVQIEEHPAPEGQGRSPQARSVTPGYFRAMGIPLVRGRGFDPHDTETAPRVVIISESMAKAYWPGEDALGKRITFNSGIPLEQQHTVGGPGSRLIVGIVGDVKHLGLAESDVPMFYTPHTQQPSYHTMRVVVRSNADPAGLTRSIREELTELDRNVPLAQVTTLGHVVDSAVAEPRLRAMLIGLFAALALALAVIGVYGVVSYLVGQRTQEIGIRRALGARAGDVLTLLVRDGMRPVVIGLALGVGVALGVTRLLASMLFGVTATDLVTYLVACGALAAAAFVASVVPARRALSVDPVSAVRGNR